VAASACGRDGDGDRSRTRARAVSFAPPAPHERIKSIATPVLLGPCLVRNSSSQTSLVVAVTISVRLEVEQANGASGGSGTLPLWAPTSKRMRYLARLQLEFSSCMDG
jgi:hypothetical protein